MLELRRVVQARYARQLVERTFEANSVTSLVGSSVGQVSLT